MTIRPRTEAEIEAAIRVAPAHPVRDLALALGGAVSVGLLWFVLSIATGLIFHFMPGATFLAASGVVRWTAHGRRATPVEAAVVIAGGAIVTAAGLVAVRTAGGSLDKPAEIAIVIVVGAAIALAWLRPVRGPGA